jgi:hypothetical protein
MWGAHLLDMGAHVVSARFSVEPWKMTRKEVEGRLRDFNKDIEARADYGKDSLQEQEDQRGWAQTVSDMYGSGVFQYPTLQDITVTVALDGLHDRLDELAAGTALTLASNPHQEGLFNEAQLASPWRANGDYMEVPATTVAYAGLGTLATVGDDWGALAGFTEADHMPVYHSPNASSEKDQLPITVIAGNTGSGKSMLLVKLCVELSMTDTPKGGKTPVVMIDLKQDSDFSTPVVNAGGRVVSLDDLASMDGAFDPIHNLGDAEGLPRAADMLRDLIAWESDFEADQAYAEIARALKFGLRLGAETPGFTRCVGQALACAQNAGHGIREDWYRRIGRALEGVDLLRLLIGTAPRGLPLSEAEGLTLIRSGSVSLDTPPEGEPASTPSQRLAVWIVRSCVYAATAALRGRQGVVALDEAWMFLNDRIGQKEIQKIGRLARSWQVQLMLASQRLKEFKDANMGTYTSRFYALTLDADSAADLLDMVRWPGDREPLMDRLLASDTMKGTSAPQWNSLKALFDRQGDKKRLLRGSVALTWDPSRRMVPVEVAIPPAQLALMDTSASAVRARQAAGQDTALGDLWGQPGGVPAPQPSAPGGLLPW